MSESNLRNVAQQDSDDSRRDGLSLATAIPIRAANAWIGVGLEYDHVIARHGPLNDGWTLESQRLRSVEGQRYDELHIVLNNGERLVCHFDITDFTASLIFRPMPSSRTDAGLASYRLGHYQIDQAAIARIPVPDGVNTPSRFGVRITIHPLNRETL